MVPVFVSFFCFFCNARTYTREYVWYAFLPTVEGNIVNVLCIRGIKHEKQEDKGCTQMSRLDHSCGSCVLKSIFPNHIMVVKRLLYACLSAAYTVVQFCILHDNDHITINNMVHKGSVGVNSLLKGSSLVVMRVEQILSFTFPTQIPGIWTSLLASPT